MSYLVMVASLHLIVCPVYFVSLNYQHLVQNRYKTKESIVVENIDFSPIVLLCVAKIIILLGVCSFT